MFMLKKIIKNKKYILILIICFVLISIWSICIINKRNNVEKLVHELEISVNHCNLKGIINLYPNYYHSTLAEYLSQDKLNEFHKKYGKINIEIDFTNKYRFTPESLAEDIQDIKQDIFDEYNVNVDIQDYYFIFLNVESDIGEMTHQAPYEVIKIKNKYYFNPRTYLDFARFSEYGN